jgi:26S proteasome regulatory subunit N1
LKEELDLLVIRSQDVDQGVQKLALDTLTSQIKSSTSSMTSVPKPLKFLRPHYATLAAFYETLMDSANKV